MRRSGRPRAAVAVAVRSRLAPAVRHLPRPDRARPAALGAPPGRRALHRAAADAHRRGAADGRALRARSARRSTPPHRRVFVGSSDHGLYAIRADGRRDLWRFETLAAVQCEPLYDADEDVVYFGSNDGALYKVAAIDGALMWRFNTNAEVARRPVIRNGVLYVVNANDTLIAIDAATGKLKWHQHRTPAFGMEVAGYAGPALGRDKVYAAFSDGTVQAYSLEDGSEQWPTVDLAAEAEQAAGGDAPRYLDVDTTPVLDRHADRDGRLRGELRRRACSRSTPRTGRGSGSNDKPLGRDPPGALGAGRAPAPRAASGPEVPARKLLLATSGLTGLWALDPTDGHTVWRRNLPEGGMTAPVPIEGALLVGTTRYGLFLFSPLDGGMIDGIADRQRLRHDAGGLRPARLRAVERRDAGRAERRSAAFDVFGDGGAAANLRAGEGSAGVRSTLPLIARRRRPRSAAALPPGPRRRRSPGARASTNTEDRTPWLRVIFPLTISTVCQALAEVHRTRATRSPRWAISAVCFPSSRVNARTSPTLHDTGAVRARMLWWSESSNGFMANGSATGSGASSRRTTRRRAPGAGLTVSVGTPSASPWVVSVADHVEHPVTARHRTERFSRLRRDDGSRDHDGGRGRGRARQEHHRRLARARREQREREGGERGGGRGGSHGSSRDPISDGESASVAGAQGSSVSGRDSVKSNASGQRARMASSSRPGASRAVCPRRRSGHAATSDSSVSP